MISEASIKLLIISLASILFVGCINDPKPSHIVGRTMGTSYSIKYYSTKTTPDIKVINDEVNRLLIEVNRQMSTYIPTSEISRLNRHDSTLEPFVISEDFSKVLSFSLQIAEETKGKFDPTIGPLVNLWGFGPNGEREVPSEEEIKKVKENIGYKLISIKDKVVTKYKPKVYVDLSASAKGFGVDKVANYLEKLELKNYMVEIGGEVRTSGSKNGESWKIAIESPHPTDTSKPFQKILKLKKHAVATSGNYRNYFEKNGKKYGHTIDFRTGKPTAHTLASVTVVNSESGMKADAWATALMVMGPVEGIEFAEKLGIAAFFIYRLAGQKEGSFVEKATSHFEKVLKL